MEDSQGSYYSNDEEYFLDVCRAGQLEELKTLVDNLQDNNLDWTCITNSHDNFLHMLAANNLTEIFDYLYPVVAKKMGSKVEEICNKQNSTGNTPLHYAVITNSKEMVLKLLQIKVNTNITNQSGRTPFAEAQEFDKIQIAEILAPLTKNNLEELKKDMEMLEVCNEDSSEDEQAEEKPSNVKVETAQQKQ